MNLVRILFSDVKRGKRGEKAGILVKRSMVFNYLRKHDVVSLNFQLFFPQDCLYIHLVV